MACCEQGPQGSAFCHPSGLLGIGVGEPPPSTGSFCTALLQTRSSGARGQPGVRRVKLSAWGTRGTRGIRGTRGTRGTGTRSRGLRGCSEDWRILHFPEAGASWSVPPFPHGGNIDAPRAAGGYGFPASSFRPGTRPGLRGARAVQGGSSARQRSSLRARPPAAPRRGARSLLSGGPAGSVREFKAGRGAASGPPGGQDTLTACPSRSGSRTCTCTASPSGSF